MSLRQNTVKPLVDADDFSVQTIALKPLHDMRMIKGSIENILSKEVINAAILMIIYISRLPTKTI